MVTNHLHHLPPIIFEAAARDIQKQKLPYKGNCKVYVAGKIVIEMKTLKEGQADELTTAGDKIVTRVTFSPPEKHKPRRSRTRLQYRPPTVSVYILAQLLQFEQKWTLAALRQ